MKDNGFAVDEKSPGRVKDLIGARKQHVLFAEKGQRIDAVVEQMRKHGISQMPVRDAHGGTVGMIHEYDLLNALVSKKQGFQDLIDALIAPLQGVVSPEATLSATRVPGATADPGRGSSDCSGSTCLASAWPGLASRSSGTAARITGAGTRAAGGR